MWSKSEIFHKKADVKPWQSKRGKFGDKYIFVTIMSLFWSEDVIQQQLPEIYFSSRQQVKWIRNTFWNICWLVNAISRKLDNRVQRDTDRKHSLMKKWVLYPTTIPSIWQSSDLDTNGQLWHFKWKNVKENCHIRMA